MMFIASNTKYSSKKRNRNEIKYFLVKVAGGVRIKQHRSRHESDKEKSSGEESEEKSKQ